MNPVTFLDETGRELARAGAPHLGDLCMWDLDGVDVARDLARGVFADAGHGELIVDPGAESALTRARATIRTAGLIVRPFKRPNPDTPAACGIYREVERDGERGNDYVLGARVRVVTGGLAAVDPLRWLEVAATRVPVRDEARIERRRSTGDVVDGRADALRDCGQVVAIEAEGAVTFAHLVVD